MSEIWKFNCEEPELDKFNYTSAELDGDETGCRGIGFRNQAAKVIPWQRKNFSDFQLFCRGRVSRHGASNASEILAYKAPPNNEGYDLIMHPPDPRHRLQRNELPQVRVQVKSRYATICDRGFPVKEAV